MYKKEEEPRCTFFVSKIVKVRKQIIVGNKHMNAIENIETKGYR